MFLNTFEHICELLILFNFLSTKSHFIAELVHAGCIQGSGQGCGRFCQTLEEAGGV